MRIAIVHDDLMRKAGGEQVVLSFHKAFPKAPIYTLCYDPENTYSEFKQCDIRVTWFNKIAKNEEEMKKFFFPLGIFAMRQHDLTEYDVILISTTYCAKYITVSSKTTVIAYCHTPFRFAWRTDSYNQIINSNWVKKKLYYTVAAIMRKVERKSVKKINYFITNALEVLPRIQNAYNIASSITIIAPPVKMDKFYVAESCEKNYYLVVSRLEPYKRVDLVINAFNKMPHKKLIIVGKGPIKESLHKMVLGNNILFTDGVDASQLAKYYAECKALIFPQVEDFGITPLEANASGRPVIALGKGGVVETMIPYNFNNGNNFTAIFFNEQTEEFLTNAIAKFEDLEHLINSDFIRSNALKFSEESFVNQIQNFIHDKISKP